MTSTPISTGEDEHGPPGQLGLFQKMGILLISSYQRSISPKIGKNCLYQPTCSQYCAAAIERYGFFGGAWRGFRRILRCNPLGSGGFDPVPERKRS